MALKLQPLPNGQRIVDENGMPMLAFTLAWQQNNDAHLTQETTQDDLIAALAAAVQAISDAQAAADAANAAAVTANAAASTAQTSANTANTAATAAANATALQDSWITGSPLAANDAGTDATITIAAHTRNYSTGSTASVNAGSIAGLAYSTLYFVYYDDAARTGGAVTYAATTNSTTAAQTGNRHTVGSIVTPAALGGATGGKSVRPPGVGDIEP